MSSQPDVGRALWRVGYHADPLGFPSRELYESSHRFDDIHGRFRTLYCAVLPETCLREVLADFRPNRGASAVRFPSRLDGNACVALFEGRGTPIMVADPIALTDPALEPLTNVTAPWRLVLEPAPAVVRG